MTSPCRETTTPSSRRSRSSTLRIRPPTTRSPDEALSATVSTNRDRVAVSRFTFELAEPKHLVNLLRTVKNVEGVYDVYRIHAAN